MLRPSYSELMDSINESKLVDSKITSRYTIVLAAAKRARQIINGAPPLTYAPTDRAVSIAIKEMSEGKLMIQVEEDMEIYTSGATNIFKYPELSDKQSAHEIITAFEEKQLLAEMVTETLSSEDHHGIQVYIGEEGPVKSMKDCSVVTATYELGDGMKGTIGIIGPKRMDYENVMNTLKTLQQKLDDAFAAGGG